MFGKFFPILVIAFDLGCFASINSSQVEMAFYSVGYLSGQSIAILFF